MKNKIAALIGVLWLTGLGSSPAAVIRLWEIAFNIDGALYNPNLGDPVPAAVEASGFDWTTGLGSLTVAVAGTGNHYLGAFFDHDIGNTPNYATVNGTPAAGQSWEADEPGYVFGNIYPHLAASALDNQNAAPPDRPFDTSLALGWSFFLDAGQSALLTLALSPDEPQGGFYLAQSDSDSDGPTTLFLSGGLQIQGAPIPDNGRSLMLLGGAVLALAVCSRLRCFRH
mgnify:CR=1 FL=1